MRYIRNVFTVRAVSLFGSIFSKTTLFSLYPNHTFPPLYMGVIAPFILLICFLYGLYTKFKKQKTKNADSEFFFSYYFWILSSRSLMKGDPFLQYFYTRGTFFPMDATRIYGWKYSYSFGIFLIYWIHLIRNRSMSPFDFIFPSFSFQKRTTESLCSIPSFRYSGDRFY